MIEVVDVLGAFALWVATCGVCFGILIFAAAWPRR